jgi:hypothetical protein
MCMHGMTEFNRFCREARIVPSTIRGVGLYGTDKRSQKILKNLVRLIPVCI